mmetsp:Transcript_4470/g.17956  ORF Transcript_4470/g.17956 Transcript_4470/m.17956 type:complete len:336 (+) Transcript_4470:2309-3316(+)
MTRCARAPSAASTSHAFARLGASVAAVLGLSGAESALRPLAPTSPQIASRHTDGLGSLANRPSSALQAPPAGDPTEAASRTHAAARARNPRASVSPRTEAKGTDSGFDGRRPSGAWPGCAEATPRNAASSGDPCAAAASAAAGSASAALSNSNAAWRAAAASAECSPKAAMLSAASTSCARCAPAPALTTPADKPVAVTASCSAARSSVAIPSRCCRSLSRLCLLASCFWCCAASRMRSGSACARSPVASSSTRAGTPASARVEYTRFTCSSDVGFWGAMANCASLRAACAAAVRSLGFRPVDARCSERDSSSAGTYVSSESSGLRLMNASNTPA